MDEEDDEEGPLVIATAAADEGGGSSAGGSGTGGEGVLDYTLNEDGSCTCKICGEKVSSRTHWYRHKYKVRKSFIICLYVCLSFTHKYIFYLDLEKKLGSVK